MTTENLIINGVDHSKFDLEWAKRGGVLYIITDHVYGTAKYDSPVGGGEHWVRNKYGGYEIHELNIRMATRDECDAAGVEYIEPPVRWRPIDTMPESGLVLVYLHKGSICVAETSLVRKAMTKETPEHLRISASHWMPLPPSPPKDE